MSTQQQGQECRGYHIHLKDGRTLDCRNAYYCRAYGYVSVCDALDIFSLWPELPSGVNLWRDDGGRVYGYVVESLVGSVVVDGFAFCR